MWSPLDNYDSPQQNWRCQTSKIIEFSGDKIGWRPSSTCLAEKCCSVVDGPQCSVEACAAYPGERLELEVVEVVEEADEVENAEEDW